MANRLTLSTAPNRFDSHAGAARPFGRCLFRAAEKLKLRRETELCLGLVHYTDGVAGTRKRIETAEKFVSDFSIGTECGFGRRDLRNGPGASENPCRKPQPDRRDPATAAGRAVGLGAALARLSRHFMRRGFRPRPHEVLVAKAARSDGPMFVLGAFQPRSCSALCIIVFHRSCWTIGDYCYLQDLFVLHRAAKPAPAAR